MAQQPPTDSPTPQRVPEGFLLTVSQHERRTGLYFCIFGLVWTAFSGSMLLFILREESGLSAIFPAGFLSLFVLVGFFLLGLGLLEVWANLKLHPAELVLPKYPLRLGETCPIHYRRRLRKGTFTKPGEIEAQLICDEWVQYTQGTDTKTKTHTLQDFELPTRTIVTGEHQADYESKIAISNKEIPSFSARHNKVRWRLVIKLKVPGIPQKCQSEFSLQVLPEVLSQ